MKLCKCIIYRLAKNDTPLAITERIKQAFFALATDLNDIKFFVNDSMHGVSGINRLIPSLLHIYTRLRHHMVVNKDSQIYLLAGTVQILMDALNLLRLTMRLRLYAESHADIR